MEITIENNELIYIRLVGRSRLALTDGLVAIRCFLLEDADHNWAGIKIPSTSFDDEPVTLPPIHCEFPLRDAQVIQAESGTVILFDRNVDVAIEQEQCCNIDIAEVGMYGIEIIMWFQNKLGGRKYVKPFLIHDI